jgi:hypothetical protein
VTVYTKISMVMNNNTNVNMNEQLKHRIHSV